METIKNILEILEPIMYVVITVAVPVLVKYLNNFLNAKKEQIDIQVEDETLNKYIDMAIDVVNQAVLTVSQTYVDSLKANGKFDSEAQKQAKNMAIDITTALLIDSVKEAVVIAYGDFNAWLDTMIEAVVKANK